MTEYCEASLMKSLIEKILSKYTMMIKDEYGTFVLCSILENSPNQYKEFVLKKVQSNVKEMSIDRDGSKLLENCIKMIGSDKI